MLTNRKRFKVTQIPIKYIHYKSNKKKVGNLLEAINHKKKKILEQMT